MDKLQMFKCIKDFIMDEGDVAFVEGKSYEAKRNDEHTYVFKDEQGDPHYMDIEDTDDEGNSLEVYLVEEV